MAQGGILGLFVRHRTLANLLMVAMLAAGLHAATQIRAQYFPDVVQSEVTVSVAWPGAGAEDVDRAIVQVMEPALMAVEGVAEVTSRASEGSARIALEFEPGQDLARATDAVQAAVDGLRDLPEGAETAQVRASAWRDQVTDVVIAGPVALDQLGRFADDLVARLYARGITRTTIRGIADPQVTVEVPTAALIRHDLTLAEVAQAIGAGVTAAPAGDLGDGSARVRTGSERRAPEEIAAIVLRSAPDGTRLTVGDVATVRAEPADRGRATFRGADPAVTVRVDRSDTGDAIRMQAEVAAVAAELRATLPPGVTVDLVRARAEQISGRLALLLDNAAMGLALVVGLLFLFLNARTALWVAAGIPVALLAALAVMHWAGLTLNMISLFALILTLGIVVDDAIVVGEHADYRARVLGEPPQVAAENAARRMGLPVAASMLTTVLAFGGLMAIGGTFGSLIADIPFTVIAVLVASLVECFLVLPHHLAHALAAGAREAWYDWPSRQVNRGFGWVCDRAVRPLTRGLIAARYPVIALAVLALALQAALFIRGDVPFRFFNAPEQSSVTGNFAMLPGATRADTLAMLREVQRAADTVAARLEAEHGTNPVTYALGEVGGGAGRGLSGADTKDADLLGGISIELIDPDLRPYSSAVFVAALQEEVRAHPLLEELSFRGGRFGPGGDALSVDLYGAEAATLKAAAEAVKAALLPFPEVSALEDSLAYDKEEVLLELTPRGAALGLTVDGLARSLRDRMAGIEAATFPVGGRTAAVRVEVPPGDLDAGFLEATLVRVAPGVHLPLADLVTVTRAQGFSTIRREGGLRVVTVTGDVAEDDPARAAEVTRALRDEILPRVAADHGVAYALSGQAEDERAFLSDAAIGFIAALVGIYLALALAFASWTRPAVVMSVIPFALVGAIWGHHHWDVALSMFSVVGLIGTVGIIVNDSIVLVSTVDDYRRDRPLRRAVVDAVVNRLRPVLLTTLTTVLGLAPLLYEDSSQAQFLKPTVITLVYGLGFGMVIVLAVVPAVLMVQADAGRALAALRRSLRMGRRARAVQAAAGAAAALFLAGPLWVAATGALPLPVPGLPDGVAAAALFLGGTALAAGVALAAARRRG